MKKIFSDSVLLFIVAFSMIFFQISCSKSEANVGGVSEEEIQTDNNPGGGQGEGGNNPSTILYLTMDYNTGDPQLRSIAMDGTNDHQINVVLPPDWFFNLRQSDAHVARKEQRIVFTAFKIVDGGPNHMGFFSCKLDGSDLIVISDIVQPENSTAELWLQDVY